MKHGLLLAGVTILFGGVISPGSAWAGEVTIPKLICDRLATQVPADGGAYTPGVDVHGETVVGADAGGGSRVKIPDEISFDYGVDLEKKYGLGRSGTSTGILTIGKVTIRGKQVFWNGQPLDAGDQAAIAAECARVYGRK